MQLPKISVCIPCYNRENFIGKTIESVLSQTDPPFEIIVLDDASTDRTGQIAKSYQNEGIKYFRNESNLGLARNWNRCFSITSGDYIQIVHHDDVLHKDYLKIISHFINKYQDEYDFFASNYYLIGEERTKNDKKIDFSGIIFETYTNKDIDKFLIESYALPCSSVVIKRKVIEDGNFFPEEYPYSPDEEFWGRLIWKGYKLLKIKGKLVGRNIYGENYSFRSWRKKEFFPQYESVFEKLVSYSNDQKKVKSFFDKKLFYTLVYISPKVGFRKGLYYFIKIKKYFYLSPESILLLLKCITKLGLNSFIKIK